MKKPYGEDGAVTTCLRLISQKEVTHLTGLCRSHIYALMNQDLFPHPVRVGLRGVRWWLHEVLAWMEARPRAVSENWQ